MEIPTKEPTQEQKEYILNHYKYNADGSLTRNGRRGKVGTLNRYGYLQIKVCGGKIYAHRIVWFLNYGEFPKSKLDHINRIRTDNSIENLRLANRKIQHENMEPVLNKDTGEQHIYLDKTTNGLKAKFVVRRGKSCKRFRNLEDAKKWRDIVWK